MGDMELAVELPFRMQPDGINPKPYKNPKPLNPIRTLNP